MRTFWSLDTWGSHVGRKGEGGGSGFRGFTYMEFPCKEGEGPGGAPGLQVPLRGIPMSERGRRTGFHGNFHVYIYIYIYIFCVYFYNIIFFLIYFVI